ncbi:MAG: MBL fold metallo-hydrolase [Chitinivibrionales bacterium]|nr:MBL fold metallo-hydrolase [Chitinivibrionales bacterium]MBD3356619.1 MBL fold metallo-hydrolase [Chitinivibrionales bacterium]
MKITILGSGTSHGVPPLDCMISNNERCPKGVCREAEVDPRHRRSRSSIAVEYGDYLVLVDVSPDFRNQALRERLKHIDAVLLTHSHADHIAGIPDIRSYTRERELTLYGSAETVRYVRRSFGYIFDERPCMEGGGIPKLQTKSVKTPFDLFGTPVAPLPVVHGSLEECFGYRIGNLAYIPDFKVLHDEAWELLSGIDTLIIDALRDTRPHSTHSILPESIALAKKLKPRKCYFTHLCHDIHYRRDAFMLEEWMHFAWDGLRITIG